MNHPDPEVQKAIIRLDDALCMWERSTFRQSILIIREMGGFVHRSVSGKPGIPEDITDSQIIQTIIGNKATS